jgi:4-diphosphocytidyl-2-C-methyl-D-erythritol kinase
VFRAFDALARPRARQPDPPRDLARELAEDGALAAWLHNDLEAPAVRLCPPIARLRAQLAGAGARAVGMSGSGATVFGVFADRAAAERAEAGFAGPARGWTRVAVTGESR